MNKIVISASSRDVILVLLKDEKIIKKEINGRNSGSKIAENYINLLKSNDLKVEDIDEYSIDIGPGSFTGIRISIAFLQGLLSGTNKKVYTYYSSDLLNLSFNENFENRVILKRARENAAYVMKYEKDKLVLKPQMILADDLNEIVKDSVLLGEESKYFIEKCDLKNDYYDVELNDEIYNKLFVNEVDISNLKPIYLQKPIAVEVWEEKNNKKFDENLL